MLLGEFINEIRVRYAKYFPKSSIYIQYSSNLYSSIIIRPLLAFDKSEVSGGILENDMFYFRFTVQTETGQLPKNMELTSELPTNLQLEYDRNSYSIKPSSPYMYCDRRKVPARMTKGDAEKLIETLDKYFVKIKVSLVNDVNNGNILPDYYNLLCSKLI